MIIAMNGRRLEGQRLGVGRYIEYLLSNWGSMLRPDEHVSVFVREPVDGRAIDPPPSIRTIVVKPRLTGLSWEFGPLSRAARGSDVLFGPSYTAPFTYRGPTVVAVHSVPEATQEHRRGIRSWLLAKSYRNSAINAATILVPSRSTRDEVIQYYGVPAERIRVIPLGVDEVFKPLDDAELLRQVRIRYFEEDVPYILFVGKMSRRRNVDVLLAAFRDLKLAMKLPHKLLLFGPNHERLPLTTLTRDLGIQDSVVQDDGRIVQHGDLVPIYNAAAAFVHPTSYDAFSIPILEAFACGTPVVTVNKGGVGEIASGFARTIEESTPEGLADALLDVLTDTELRDDLRARGTRRAAQFRWAQTASATLRALREAATVTR